MKGFLTDGLRDAIAVFGLIVTILGFVRISIRRIKHRRRQQAQASLPLSASFLGPSSPTTGVVRAGVAHEPAPVKDKATQRDSRKASLVSSPTWKSLNKKRSDDIVEFWFKLGAVAFLVTISVGFSSLLAYSHGRLPNLLYSFFPLFLFLTVLGEVALLGEMLISSLKKGGLDIGCSAPIILILLLLGVGLGFSSRFRPFAMALLGDSSRLTFRPTWLGYFVAMHSACIIFGGGILLVGLLFAED